MEVNILAFIAIATSIRIHLRVWIVLIFFLFITWFSTLLVRDWPYSVFGQNHLFVKMLFNRDFTIQKCFRRFCNDFKSEDFGSLSAVRTTCHPVRMPICLLFHPSGRRVIPSGRPTDQASSVRTSQQPVRTPLSDRSASNSFQVQFKGRLLQPSEWREFPSGRAHT
jgi:hypothetical protein